MRLIINYLFTVCILLTACDTGPKVIEAESASGDNTLSTSVSDVHNAQSASNNEEHKVVVEEVLNTSNYSYLNVEEDGKKFWIAIPKKEVTIGETYYFKGGLLKKNFHSKEHDRVFETVYLVSDVHKQPIGSGGSAADEALNKIHGHGSAADNSLVNVEPAEGAIKLSELFSSKEKYEGQVVKVTGKCVKMNPNIMGRNWVHIQDGSGGGLDLTVTTAENVPVGQVVTLEGTITLNKDFGAGYQYAIIMEEAKLK